MKSTHTRSAVAAAFATVVAAAAIAVPTANASAPPERIDPEPSYSQPAQTATYDSPRPCFIVQAHWNAALDGDVPVC